MGYNTQSIPYPAKYDYGARPKAVYPTLAVVFHMAEGTNVAQYLSGGNVARGVSVHYTIEQKTSRWRDGQVVRCMKEWRISGSINPDTLRTSNDKTLFGYKHAKAALGKWWSNPNVAVISVEVAGRNAQGPTEAQVRSMVALFEDIDSRYGGKVIPLGHRDFQNVKPCPGKSAGIRAAYAAMGGHGKDHDTSGGKRYMSTRAYQTNRICDVVDGAAIFDYPGGPAIGSIDPPLERDFLGYSPNGRDFALVSVSLPTQPTRTAWTKASKVANIRTRMVEPESCDETAIRQGALDEAGAAVAAVEA